MASDPFRWAAQYASDMNASASRDGTDAQNALLSVFREEAARQRPFSSLPVDLAKQNNQYDLSLRNSKEMSNFNNTLKGNTRRAIAPEKIRGIIVAAARKYGLDSDMLMTIADIESKFNPNAKNPGSSASGLFQFVKDTARQYGLTDPFDPYANADAGARFIRDNIMGLQKALGRKPTTGEIYLAHQQGLGGATALLSNPNASAASIVGRNAIRLNGGRFGMSAGQFAQIWTNKADKLYSLRSDSRSRNGGEQTTAASALDNIATEAKTDEHGQPLINDPVTEQRTPEVPQETIKAAVTPEQRTEPEVTTEELAAPYTPVNTEPEIPNQMPTKIVPNRIAIRTGETAAHVKTPIDEVTVPKLVVTKPKSKNVKTIILPDGDMFTVDEQ